VAADRVGLYILPFALGNFLGPLLLGPLFDTLGRKSMIAGTYALAGILLAVTGQLFEWGWLTATTQTVLWTVVFFFASAAASAAYLTVGECFPLEVRALTIALFYAFGTLLGGVGGPWLFGILIEDIATGDLPALMTRDWQLVNIATGGGTFVDVQNRAAINGDGVSVWLDVPLDRLIARVPADGRRPLAADRAGFERLYHLRRAAYEQAHVRLDAGRASVDALVEQLVDWLEH